MKIYKVDIGEILTIAANDKTEVAALTFIWVLRTGHVGCTDFLQSDYWANNKPANIKECNAHDVITMAEPARMVATVEWLTMLITQPQVIGSSEC